MPVALVVALLLLFAPPASAGESRMITEPTNGGWTNELCAPDYFDPDTGKVDCWGATQFVGTWTGHTIAHVQGQLDSKTGDIRIDRIDEFFIGMAPDGSHGTLHFLNRGYLDASDRVLYLESDILQGTGDWAGATGKFVFDGFMTGPATGWGGWHGEWTRPAKKS